MTPDPWADMPSDTLDADNVAVNMDEAAKPRLATAKPATEYTEPCKKCGGRGTFSFGYIHRQVGQCFACKGAGHLKFKTSPETRAKARDAAERQRQEKVRQEQERRRLWREAHKDVVEWLAQKSGRFDFATALDNALAEWGTLTERQVAAVRNCITNDAARAQARADNAPIVSADHLKAAFDKAKASGLKRPKMSFDGFTVSLAPDTGKNPGAIYVKASDGTYLGKVAGGRLFAVRDCPDSVQAEIAALMSDPLKAAQAYGKRTGQCCICARELTDPSSIEEGIGPICARRFF